MLILKLLNVDRYKHNILHTFCNSFCVKWCDTTKKVINMTFTQINGAFSPQLWSLVVNCRGDSRSASETTWSPQTWNSSDNSWAARLVQSKSFLNQWTCLPNADDNLLYEVSHMYIYISSLAFCIVWFFDIVRSYLHVRKLNQPFEQDFIPGISRWSIVC